MGAGQSGQPEIDGSSMGYQVLRVHPNSPGSRCGLKAYFDFIIAIGNTRFNKEDGSLREILKASVDQKLKMVVYNTRTKKTREVEIAPSTNWGGNGLLGVSIKHSSFDRAEERVWHVVDVEPGSPAQQAGFISNEDYVIGSDSILQENDDLYNLVEAHEGKALKLFVYNIRTDNCRDVICHPNSRWGGKGYLGCEFGHGLLHRIPYGNSSGDFSNNPRASLLRNEQPVATQQIDQNYSNFSLQRALAQQQQLRQSQAEQQPHQGVLKDQRSTQYQEQNITAAPQLLTSSMMPQQPEANNPIMPQLEINKIPPPQTDPTSLMTQQADPNPLMMPQPDPSRSMMQQPDSSRPMMQQPDSSYPVMQQTDPSRLMMQQPNANPLVMQQPDLNRPMMQQPNPNSLMMQQPDPSLPMMQQPDPNRPMMQQPEAPRTFAQLADSPYQLPV